MRGDRRLSRHSYYDDGIRVLPGNYTLYVDESWFPYSEEEEYFTVAGLLMHRDGVAEAERGCYEVMRGHEGLEDGRMCELKFTHMMGGKEGFPGADGCNRGPASGILKVIGREYMPFFCMVVDQREFKAAKKLGYDSADHYATEQVIIEALDRAGGPGRYISVIRDDGNDKRDDDVEELLKKGENRLGDSISNIKSYKGYSSEKSEGCRGLQLADFCAGAVARIMGPERAGRDLAGCYCLIRRLQDTPKNRRGIPAFYPSEGAARSRFVRMGHTCPCVSGWHAFLRTAGRQ
ncbi:MAG: DUF3800 domain-containing protein [Alphaproteobacteria bacterium]|nr:DUF3800 domain-containing protein [Alphaproteobacteria bacterium]